MVKDPLQRHKSLDVVGTNSYGKTEGIQSKRYQEFTVADLDTAVDKYTGSTLQFTLVRFAVGVACKVDDRAVGERKAVLNGRLYPLEIDVWDRSRISEMLRDKPEIVIKYFGPRAAERFCVPHALVPVEIPGPDAVATADAVLHGPLAIADAQGLLDSASDLATTDPVSALARYRDVQRLLTDAGFPGHAAEFNETVATLCVRADEEAAAIRLLMDELWAAESSADNLRADRVAGVLRDLAGLPMFGSRGTPRTPALGAAFEIADFVTDHLHAPVPTRLELPASAMALADGIDRARTIAFAAERALADDDPAWVIRHQEQIESALAEVGRVDESVGVRLRLALADATGDWAALIRDARTRMRRELKAATLARHARYMLLQASYMDADNEWSEAVEAACLAQRHEDAADWLYSQRFLANRWRGIVKDRWHPLARALSDLPSRPRIVTTARDVRERALAAMVHDEPRTAAINLRRQLLDAVRSVSIFDELDACRLLGQVYRGTGEVALAAYYTIRAGDYKTARTVATAFGDVYHAVTNFVNSQSSWVSATALQFTTEQADLIPDQDVDAIVELAFAVINDVKSGARLDSPVLSPQMYLSAYGLVAALARRLSAAHARTALDMLAGCVEVEEHHYRRTDESHVEIAAGISRSHAGALRAAAIEQLVGLYSRGAHPFPRSARDALLANLEQTGERMRAMADAGHHEAAALLGYSEPDRVSADIARAAAERLCKPTTSSYRGWGVGTGAVNDSLLACGLPVVERIACIDMLLSNAAAPWEPSSNRDDYLIAASNLIDDLDDEHHRQYFELALKFAEDPAPSHADAADASMKSPLGGIRINDRSDCRPAAAFLAARLARSSDEKRLARDAALRLIGVGGDEDYRVTTALQRVQSELDGSIGLLAQGSWTLRSLAAILWAESADMPSDLGLALSRDRDVRVRRSLATALVNEGRPGKESVFEALQRDPRWSVRSIVQGGE